MVAIFSFSFLPACSSPSPSNQDEKAVGAAVPIANDAPACVVTGDANPAAIDAWKTSTEANPLYRATLATSRLESCSVEANATKVELRYRFANGNSLRAAHDDAIESVEFDAGFAHASAQPALDLLAAAERAAFGPKGCGIDYQRPGQAGGDPGHAASETVFRGPVCNCQARVRNALDGTATGLRLSSTC